MCAAFTTAAIIGSIAAAASVGTQMAAARRQERSANQAAEEAAKQNAAAVQSIKDQQSQASTKAADTVAVKRRAIQGSQTVFTSPLGITDQAATAKKTLLGQ